MSHTCRLCQVRRRDIERLELELAVLRQLVDECESISVAYSPTAGSSSVQGVEQT